MKPNVYRTHACGDPRAADVGLEIRVAGWMHRRRDHGGLLFMDLRDASGMLQLCFLTPESRALVKSISKETVLSVTGNLRRRPEDAINPNTPTGEVELVVSDVRVLSKAAPLPFEVGTEHAVSEDLRLAYRFLDLRRERMARNIRLRAEIILALRLEMHRLGFLEFQTPILTNSSPEGARDFLVPSRLHPGKFYALPQAPQQYKQLLMASGVERYFQIAPCFRDEPARADRSPGEFYQLDMEMSYVTQDDVFDVIEEVLCNVFKKFSDYGGAERPFPRLPYKEAMLRYGTDKPDLRNPLEIADVSDLFADSSFKVFAGKSVRVMGDRGCIPSRAFLDKLNESVRSAGHGGLAWLTIDANGQAKGPIAKVVSQDVVQEMLRRANATTPVNLLFSAHTDSDTASKILGEIRNTLGQQFELLEQNVFRFCWIVDFPMYERDEQTNRVQFSHNPFSMPQGGLHALQTKDPLEVLAYQYDIVCNGVELSSGAVRNHDPETMIKAFAIAGHDTEAVETKFPALYRAFQFGTPPHAGLAPGIDRIVMLLAKERNIREVIAFPLNQSAYDPLMNAPSVIDPETLAELGIRVVAPPAQAAGGPGGEDEQESATIDNKMGAS